MVISKKHIVREQLLIRWQPIKKVQKYSYLGTWVNEDWEYSKEIKFRVEMARVAVQKMFKLFKFHDFSLGAKIRLLRVYIYPILLYGAETWKLTNTLSKKN